MDIQKEREAFEAWLFREYPNAREFIIVYRPDENTFEHRPTQVRWEAWQAAKAQANKQFENFIDQAIEDSACADERRSLQVLLEDFQDNIEADKRQGQKRVSVNLEDL